MTRAGARVEAPTIAEPRGRPDFVRTAGGQAAPDTSPTSADGARSIASQTALRAMRAADTVRATEAGLALATLAALGLALEVTVYRSGSPVLRHVAMALLGATVVGGLVVRALRRAPEGIRVPVSGAFGVVLVATSVVESLHLGVFSAFQGAITLVIGLFGFIDRRRIVLPLTLAACVGYIVPALAIATGAMRDPGVFDSSGVSDGQRVAAAVGTLCVFGAAVWLAMASRRSLKAAVEQANAAMLLARQRDLLLAEANLNLDALLARGAGRFTGATVGPFVLGSVVGRGAMGEVYSALRATDGRGAAVKMLAANVVGDPSMLERFLREAQNAGKLHVPNVVEVLGSGAAADGSPYLAMERLAGHDLGWHLRQRTRLEIAEVVTLVEQVALGLEAAHKAGIVHRDLKPQNLFLHEGSGSQTVAPVWKILDFGVSRLRGSTGTLTEGAIVGTPGYMAPEQVRSGDVDARADLFALGAVAYRALTGQPAFGVDYVQSLFDVVYRQPTRPGEMAPDLPASVDLVLAIALAKKPADRFATAAELASAFRDACQGKLPVEVRARGEALVVARPWGCVQSGE